ncbi:type I secretion system permease/ATPase [Providencia stuartii]|uniref:Alpha-hemolysin translocation ATP-binding protein HlyB n=2 Tax=Providencia stuartii TaxID=588 RepID=A0AAJ1N4G1_PROST|nr:MULTISPECIES: type I secretion system permease/ATPase [Providencia]EMA3640363.1 type I secretion system permease/ATPase [Providencia stuartii]MCB5215911.1 type I secretion system permease/ATPase [Providencia stuartii]MDE8748909.1 type I secretion system permease/ATPase [Providencia thailandensis]MDE8768209.1 type I secretion system permease/ATPase [Providencia thailandensis]MDE8772527.1 type I secretion system permease/ATPase [Providencia thailandensis]
MESENTQSTLYFIGIIIKLTNDISQDEFNTITAEKESFRDTLKALQNKLNIKCKYKNQTNKNISKIDSPSIIYDNDNVAYLLANFNHEQVLIQRFGNHPPELWSMDKFIQMWSGKWLQVKTKQSQFDITWFKTEFLKYKYIIASVLLFSFILQILALVTPIIIQVIMDKVLVHNSMMTLDLLIFGLIIAAILEVTLKGLREYVYNHTVNRIDMTLGLKLVNHLLHLPLSFFKTRQIGSIVTRVKELETIREFLTGSFFTLCVDVLFLFVFLYVMSLLSSTLMLVFLCSIPFYLLVAWWLTPKIEAAAHKQFANIAINTSFLTESINGIETAKSLSIEPNFTRRWDQQTSDMSHTTFAAGQINSRSEHIVMVIEKLTSAVILWIGASEVLALQLTIGQFIAFHMMVNHASQPLVKLVKLWGDYIRTKVAIEKLAQIINLPTEQTKQADNNNTLKGHIHLRNISFRYQPDMPYILDNFNLSIQAGETLGIVGTSGSGKSTLARLLLRLYTPEKGTILLDGTPLSSMNIHSLRRQIGIVLQENFLFNQTVFDNIAQTYPNASMDEVIHAAKMAGAHDFILKLPMGYDTILSEGGASLSGGQRQRIAIARTLLADPKIIIFDEATSALDDESQAIIQKNMQLIAQGRTVITIAHRLSTIRHHQRIIVMQQGKIVEQGSHQQLLEQGQFYQHLWALQQSFK